MGHPEAVTLLSSDPLPDLGRMQSERLMHLQQHMADQGVAGAVLLHGPHVAYATGYVTSAVDSTHAVHDRAVAIVGAEGPAHLFANDPPSALIAETHLPLSPELDESIPELADALRMVIDGRDRPRIAIDELTGAMLRSGLFDDFDTVDASRVLGPARLLKTEDELACIDRAQRINEVAMEEVRGFCVPGTRRSQLAAVFVNRVRELGVEDILIDPIFQPMPKNRSDPPRTSTGHVAFPTGVGDPTFAEGDVVWVDTGIDVEGYASDYGRTWIVGREPNQAERTLFARWAAVMDGSLTAIRPGATLAEVARAATKADGGVRPWLPHFYLSHGVGVESAEMPMIGTDLGDPFDESFTLEAGMVLVLEPVTWEDGVGGYRAEEIVAVTEDGWRPLGGQPGYSPFDT